MKSPCFECKKRQKPKLCESSCEKWKEYLKDKEEKQIIIKKKKMIDLLFWRN